MTQPTRNQILGTGLLTGVALLAALPGILKKLDGTTRSVVLVSGALGTAMATKATTDWCNLPEKIFWTILTHAAIYGAAAAIKSKKFVFTLRGAAWLAGAQVVGILIPHWAFAKKVERHPDDPAEPKSVLFVYSRPADQELLKANLPPNVTAEFQQVQDEFAKIAPDTVEKTTRIFLVYYWNRSHACLFFAPTEGRFRTANRLIRKMREKKYDIHLLLIRDGEKPLGLRNEEALQPYKKEYRLHQFRRSPGGFLRFITNAVSRDPTLEDQERFHKLVLGDC